MNIVALPPTSCPDCSTALDELEAEQPALFFHGGYGATERSVVRRCPECGWTLRSELGDISPRTKGGDA